jgi:hypothetical protein
MQRRLPEDTSARQVDRQSLALLIVQGEETTALSIAATSLTASMVPSSCIFLPSIRWADQPFSLGSLGGSASVAAMALDHPCAPRS